MQHANAVGRRGPGPTGPPKTTEHAQTLPNWCSAGPYARDDEPLYTTMTRTAATHKVYHNAYWHANKWYALVPPPNMMRPGEQPHADDADPSIPEPTPESETGSEPGSGSNSTTGTREAGYLEEGLSVNCALIRLPIKNITSHTDNMRAGFLPGTTLLVDFPFPAFPDNLGHWAEIMLPTFSVLADGSWRYDTSGNRSRFVDRILLPNLRKPGSWAAKQSGRLGIVGVVAPAEYNEMNDWFREVLALAVSPGVRRGGAPVPPIIDHTDLEAYPKLSWLVIENLLVIQDRYTHPDRKTGFIGVDHGDLWRYDGCARYVDQARLVGFSEQQFAADFRAAAYKRANLAPPPQWTPGSPPPPPVPGSPRFMTLVMAHEDYPPLINWSALQGLLRQLGRRLGLEVRTVTLSTDAPFVSHLDTFARSSVVVARHGPLLATAPLMPPGGAVIELLPYKWEWLGISKLYYNITQSTGDLHHFAWRPTDHRLAHYDHENYTRYHSWTPEECSARECLMVHARAGLTVDLTELEAILEEKLPAVVEGRPVDELRAEWPKAV
ncbi:hypothetical protein GPECTOR_116g356 [Gonium pectorale]|uniref:Uncharacterized protein n=1 Tax=Gonium pectorale TaxID=33097 RepID=A0A150FYZ5_GONPE|nr:hypothetical protein GPECTOR_116g356 [Gonium pectorale]|eukprot:KXZ42824.1 hypothetical protein GPECTOR_116g356 [Gonium pectorale]